MIHTDWEKDYHDEFICPKCEQAKLRLGNIKKEKITLNCPNCKRVTLSSINLSRRSLYLDSRLKDEYIDWSKDYQGEFTCPICNTLGMSVMGINNSGKRRFRCSNCKKNQESSHNINIQAVADPVNLGVTWYTNHLIKDFICPKCQSRDMYFDSIDKHHKKRFKCHTCRHVQQDLFHFNMRNISRFSEISIPLQGFNWSDDRWDLRMINSNFDVRDNQYCIADFTSINPDWFKKKVKKYVQHLCKKDSSFGTIRIHLHYLKNFSHHIDRAKISTFDEINRNFIIEYLIHNQRITTSNLSIIRSFFRIGNIKGWFNVNQNIIHSADFPKQYKGNPDPISNTVREQIEKNLHTLPDPIARVWLVGYFSAMRPSELALLKQDCLIQEGQYWELVWHRKKTNDYHKLPISRTIAKIVQEQIEYIQNLWGDKWEYLFCHYHNLSEIDPFQLRLEPVKKIIPIDNHNPLAVSIRTLLKKLDIRDENGKLATFTPKLLRSTRLTELFDQGHELFVVSAWAGHKRLVTTSTYYTEVSCELMEKEAGHIQQALVNSDGHRISYESFPKSFWENPTAHKLELADTHINTPIYGYCGLPLYQDCHKFRACYTCQSFVATVEKLPQYLNVLSELRAKQAKAMSAGQEVLVEQFGRQAEQLDKIIASLQQEAA